MIIMGSRGRTGLARLVLGSTAEKVIRSSHCSVLVTRGDR
jgi:nucleotide-binding universal stress UspA family protein